jgi:hypothetical protein
MIDAELLVEDILENRVAVKELSTEELDAVVESLTDIGQSMLDTDQHDIGIAILRALDSAIDMHYVDEGFEQAIVAAEARGSVYWEYENPSVH